MIKTKLYKNANRGKNEPFEPGKPAYQALGIKPQKISAAHVPAAQKQLTYNAPVVSYDNPRTRPPPTFQKNIPYATDPQVQPTLGTGSIPNVGNNMETAWTSVDDDLENDVVIFDENFNSSSLNPNQPMINNNDDDEKNYQYIPKQLKKAPNSAISNSNEYQEEEIEFQENSNSNFDINQNEYVLVIYGSIICIGSLEVVQEEVRSLVFGEHELNKDNNITPDDLIVLKRVNIKVGVFLD